MSEGILFYAWQTDKGPESAEVVQIAVWERHEPIFAAERYASVLWESRVDRTCYFDISVADMRFAEVRVSKFRVSVVSKPHAVAEEIQSHGKDRLIEAINRSRAEAAKKGSGGDGVALLRVGNVEGARNIRPLVRESRVP